jgi:hypothetical protein
VSYQVFLPMPLTMDWLCMPWWPFFVEYHRMNG